MSFGYSFPIYEAVNVVNEKNSKADYNGKIGDIRHCRHYPENNQNYIVCCICNRKVCTSAEGEINRNETGCNGQCAEKEIYRIEVFEDVIENNGNNSGQNKHKNGFFFAYVINFNLGFFAFIRIFKPRNQRKSRHGTRHADIGYHFSVICKRK